MILLCHSSIIVHFLVIPLIVQFISPVMSEDLYENTLKLVHVIFRHGDRTNDASTTYPKDPYINETYCPYGLGELTSKGKRRQYGLGKQLRQRYDKFLGDIYCPNILDAFTTEISRAKMSLELVLAGLFPPRHTVLEWDKELNWQPIPYKHLMFADDHLMAPAIFFCPEYRRLFRSYIHSAEALTIERKYAELYNYLSLNTGVNVTSTFDVFKIYFTLISEEEWGFKLPLWTRSVYPNYMKKAAIDFYLESIATDQLKQLAGGFLLKKIINDTGLKLIDELSPPNRKIFLYSGHELNIVYLLGAMRVYFPHVPPYSSCIMIEVHTIDKVDGIKIFYENYSGNEPILLKVPGCDCFCPFTKFVQLLERHIPDDNMCG